MVRPASPHFFGCVRLPLFAGRPGRWQPHVSNPALMDPAIGPPDSRGPATDARTHVATKGIREGERGVVPPAHQVHCTYSRTLLLTGEMHASSSYLCAERHIVRAF
jgi:hypothetical protein